MLVPASDPVSGSVVTDLKKAILHKNGHGSQINATVSSTTLTLNQTKGGIVGNTTIESSFNNPGARLQIAITGTPANGETFSLTDEANTTQTFIIDTSVTTQDGTRDGSNRVIVGFSGLGTSKELKGKAIASAINGAREKGFLADVYAARRYNFAGGAQEFIYVFSNTPSATNFDGSESVTGMTISSTSNRTLPSTLTIGNFIGGIDGFDSRVEAFKILAQGSKLYVLPPNSKGIDDSNLPIIDHNIQGAQTLREPLAKRPVNIRNIQNTSSARAIGNFRHIYDIVQYTSEDQRKDFLVDNLEQVTS